ncbi:MAG: hypothetical protein MZV49_10645 [Rhodopseudomonas palustris]|nr:hypothetical protein [Rhodopseudomonas palustris]
MHLALVLMLGLYIPPYLADWYRAGGAADREATDMTSRALDSAAATRCPGARRRGASTVDADGWRGRGRATSRRAAAGSLALWGRDHRDLRRRLRVACRRCSRPTACLR